MKMMCKKIFACLIVIQAVFDSAVAVGAGRFTELVLPFDEVRDVEFHAEKATNTVVFLFKNTTPDELGALNLYDERLIKRVIIKDLGPAGSQVSLVLRNQGIKVSVSKRTEPFRVVVTLFDREYQIESDPQTGLPLAGIGEDTTGYSGSSAVLQESPQRFVSDLPSSSPAYSDKDNSAAHGSSLSQRKLLQPTPDMITSPGELVSSLQKIDEGRSKHWKLYPSYVYPLQTAAFEGRKEPTGWIKSESNKAMSSAQAMAEYAYKLFTFGHDGRALVAYQQVLRQDPSIFSKDALHLWAFAESHFAHGNTTLAVGYYDLLMKNHPESALAKFAALRKLDASAVKIIKSGQSQRLAELLPSLSKINPGNSAELQTQKAIRQAYWSPEGIQDPADAKYLPAINEEVKSALTSSYVNVESPKTAFLASSILLKYMTDPKKVWSDSYGKFANQYFQRFKGKSGEPYVSNLKRALKGKIGAIIASYSDKKDYAKAVQSFESLPRPLRSVKKDPKVAWSLAEAYRNEGLYGNSLPLYRSASKGVKEGVKKFQVYFWTAVMAETIAEREQLAGRKSKLNSLRRQSNNADRKMSVAWSELKDDEKSALATAYKEHFEKTVMSSSVLKTPPQIVLETWTNALSSRIGGSAGSATSWEKNFSVSASSIFLLQQLAKRFKETGQMEKRRKTIRVMQAMKPEEFEDDKKARKVWANELLSLAEEYRKANNYLEAGRLYAFTASNNTDVDSRAETLYKGGLLLYRSGHREEALKAFTAASEDGNNLFYANLAKERLSQLQK